MADDYSDFATPVANGDDYSGIASPVENQKSVQEKAPDFKLNEKEFYAASPLGRLKMILSHPWEKYKQSVDQAYKGPEIPRIEAPSGTSPEDRAKQVGAALTNTGSGLASGLISPGTIANVLSPGTMVYSAPRFLAGGIESLLKAAEPSDAGLQDRIENTVSGGLQIVGAVAGGLHGAKGAMRGLSPKAPIPEAIPKAPEASIVTKVDDASSKTNPVEANAAANEIATQPIEADPEPIKAAIPQEPVQAPVEESKPVEANAKAITAEAVDKMTPDEFTKYYQTEGNALTDDAILVGKATTEPNAIKALIDKSEGLKLEFKDALKEGDVDKASAIAFKQQWFSEAYQNATKTGAYAEKAPDIISNFDKEWVDQGRQGGSENQIIMKDGRVYKRNYNEGLGKAVPNHGTLDALNEHVALHNELFPETALKFEGMSETSDGLAPVFSQAEVKGTEATPKEVREFMAAKGFEPYSGSAYINPDLGIRVGDLKGDNVIKDVNGELHVIDPVIKKIGSVDTDYSAIATAVEKPKENAIQIQSPESVSIPAQAQAGEEVGQQVRRGGELADPRQEAQAAVDANAELLSSEGRTGMVFPDKRSALENAGQGQEVRPTGGGGYEIYDTGGGGSNVPPAQIPGPSPSFNNPLPNQGWTPFISKTKIGQHIKTLIGTIEGNIRKVAPEVFGALRERGFKLNEMKKSWHDSSKDYGEFSRKYLKPEAFTELDRLLQSGLHDEALAYIKGSKYEPQLKEAIINFKETLDTLREAEIQAGRKVGNLDDYWIREVADYEGLRRELGRDPSHAAEKALKQAAEQKKRPLTTEEQESVINNLISLSVSGQGKPGFLNARTIGEIQKNWFKYYEPSDVAMENRINRVAKDVVNRAYFGKFDPDPVTNPSVGSVGGIEGTFGEIINRMINQGQLSAEGSKIVVRNLQDFFSNDSRYDSASATLANSIRKAQTYAYLGDMANAIPQYGDFFLGAWRNGFFDASKGFFTKRKFNLSDIGIHEGNPDTAVFSKKNSEGLVGKVFRNSVNLFLGVSDRFNKGGLLNTSFHEAARDIRNTNSSTFKQLNSKWSERYPERWPEILKDLQGDKFARGELTPNTRFFLYSELADLQPISGEATAQAFNRVGPWGKILYGLRSFAIKQIDVMRQEGYEKMRDPKTRSEGLKNLVTYALIVGAGQQFVGSYLRDKLLDRQTDPSEYAVSGLLQLMGFNRYSLYRAKEQGVGTALVEMAVPGVGILNDLTQSLGVTRDYLTKRRSQKTGAKTVPTFADALANMEALKYVPGIGRELYSYVGLGRKKEDKRRAEQARGKTQATTIQQISDMVVPPDKKN